MLLFMLSCTLLSFKRELLPWGCQKEEKSDGVSAKKNRSI